MKRLIALAVLAVGVAVPTHAQTIHAAAGGGSSSVPAAGGGVGGGGFSGGFGGVAVHNPSAHFSVTSVSGSPQEFVPSTFVSYDKAVAEGQNVLDTPEPTVAEAARKQGDTHAEKAKLALVQNYYGKAIIVPR